ncbi:aspartic proteinase precursor [Trametes versicolor FP-101664 SS1]|uniref:aspartic proteinase precursor n=1 Tax=Trametes versicolor (strain FP-101664) TaxID=717944 RepID=UPI000462150F|nr:aspartic proteinase precursor [Trametes versicolor FP-101664 SS1]EIW58441.1 aspartic proteinase precursor [Trametes versicolor FP-101664 SS1]
MKTFFTPSSLITALLVLLSLAADARSTPVVPVRSNGVHLPVAKRFNFTGAAKILERDQARVRKLRARAAARLSGETLSPDVGAASVLALNQATQYVVTAAIGTPPTTYELVVDTGSGNTWVGAGQVFRQTSSTRQTRDHVVSVIFTDSFQLSSSLPFSGQSFGVASEQNVVQGVDGILGLGPAALTVGTLSPDSNLALATVTDNLFSQGVIPQDMVAISFQPTDTPMIVNGELTFGGTDTSKITGTITFAPITSTSPSSLFFGISQTVRYGTSTRLLNNAPGIFDSGTTLVLLATDALKTYTQAVGAVFDNTTQLYRITNTQFSNLQSLFFTINGVVFEFTANAQIWPRALNALIGGNTDSIYLIIGDIGSYSGSGLDFVNGQTFMERFYTVFDTENRRVGVANTPFTRATTN